MVWAARKGHLECVKHLLAMGADVDQEGAVSSFSILIPGNREMFLVLRDRIFSLSICLEKLPYSS